MMIYMHDHFKQLADCDGNHNCSHGDIEDNTNLTVDYDYGTLDREFTKNEIKRAITSRPIQLRHIRLERSQWLPHTYKLRVN